MISQLFPIKWGINIINETISIPGEIAYYGGFIAFIILCLCLGRILGKPQREKNKVQEYYFKLQNEAQQKYRDIASLVKKKILELGTKYDRLEIKEIMEISNIEANLEDFVVKTINDMINNKEIYAEYFSSSKSIAFNSQANMDEIDNLMKVYEEWEKNKVNKKI